MPSEMVQQAIALIKTGQKGQARQILLQILKAEPLNESAWLWLTETLNDDEQRIRVLQQCLKLIPHSQAARQGLERLQAKQQTERQPTTFPENPSAKPEPTESHPLPPAAIQPTTPISDLPPSETSSQEPVTPPSESFAPAHPVSSPASIASSNSKARPDQTKGSVSKYEWALLGIIVILIIGMGGFWLISTLNEPDTPTPESSLVATTPPTPTTPKPTFGPAHTFTPLPSPTPTRPRPTSTLTQTTTPSPTATASPTVPPEEPGSLKIAYYSPDSSTGLSIPIYTVWPPAKPETAYPVNSSERVEGLFFSADGQHLFYTVGNITVPEKIFSVSLAGAPSHLLIEVPPPNQNGFSFSLQEIAWQPGTPNLVMEIQRQDMMGPIAGYAVVNTETGKTRKINVTEDERGRYLSVFSPDRRFVAAIGPGSISLVNLETGQVFDSIVSYSATGLPNSDAFFIPDTTWSADSSFFFTARLSNQSTQEAQVYLVDRIDVNGKVSKIADIPGAYVGEDRPYPRFTPDGQWMFYYGTDGLHQYDLAHGNDQFIAMLDPGEYRWEYTAISPDGQALLFTGHDGLYWLSIQDGKVKKVAPPGKLGIWAPDSSRCVIVVDGQVSVVDIGGNRHKVEPRSGDSVYSFSVKWVDATHLLYLAKTNGKRTLYVQSLGGNATLISAEDEAYTLRYAAWAATDK